MIKFKSITAKNFLSIGNITQALNLDTENLTLILGENLDQGGSDSGSKNGVGKTAILNALCFGLYGQALTNIKKDNLVNNINNKNMIVTVLLEKDGVEYKIERGRKPAIFNFVNMSDPSKNQESDSQGESKDTQKDIDVLLNMSLDMFKHIVALNTYTQPFLLMKANDQRVIIEELLGITILSEKAEVLKEQIKHTKDQIFQETTEIEMIKKSNERIQQSIDTLLMRQRSWKIQHNKELESIATMIVELEGINIENEIELHNSLTAFLANKTKLKGLTSQSNTLAAAVSQATKTYNQYYNELNTLQHKKCPHCDQELHDDKHQEMVYNIQVKVDESKIYLDKVSSDLELINDEINKIGVIGEKPVTYYATIEEALTHQNNIQKYSIDLEKKVNETDPYQEQIDDLRGSAIQTISWDRVNMLSQLKDHQEYLLKLLTNKDSFIRKKIIDQNIPYLNNRLEFYLDRLGSPHRVKFQSDLSVEIDHNGKDLDFGNLSGGEGNRLIFSLDLAFRDVWESLYQGMNLLFVDEIIDSALDLNGVENALSVLKQISRERNKNIFLVSHREELVGRVNHVLRVTKENNFTSYSDDVETI